MRSVSPEGIVFRIATATGTTFLVAPWAAAHASSLVDSEVAVRGVWMNVSRPDGSLLRALLVEEPTQLSILKRAPDDPFTADAVRIGAIAEMPATDSPTHRIKVAGTVTASMGRSLYLTDGVHHVRVRPSIEQQFSPGDVVEAVGFVAEASSSPVLADAVVRRVGKTQAPRPLRLDPARLLDRRHDHALVTVQARLVRHAVDVDEHELLLTAEGITFEASLPAAEDGASLEALTDGSLLEVIGIADVQSRGAGPLQLEIELRRPQDVTVIASPPWWTSERAAYIVGILLVGCVGAGGWVVALRRRLPAVERARVETEQRYRQLFEEAPVGHFVSRPDGTFTACNGAFARMLAFTSPEEALLADCASLCVNPSDREHWLTLLRQGTPVENLEVTLRTRDGRIVHAVANAVARLDSRREIVEIQGTLVDRTEHKQTEIALRERDAQLLQSQKMEAVGRLAGGVAHDFNNLLTAIAGFSDLARERHTDGAHVLDCLEEVQKAARSAAGLTNQLLAFSRKHVFQPSVLDLNAIVTDVEKMLRRLLGEDIELTVALCADPVYVTVDRAQLEQALVNLAVNARDAMPRGGRLRIETRLRGSEASLAVSDTGCGMDEDTKARIFDPFFTTKEPGRGTGLGLAMVYGTIVQSGGTIEVESEPLHGTTFTLTWPGADRPPAEPASTPRVHIQSNGSETILVVEDAQGVRTLTRRVLEQAGYRVLVASDGREALTTAGRHDGSIELLVSDIVMPGMSGPELAESLTAAKSQMRVLFMSGYADHPVLKHQKLPTSASLLQKPFTPDALKQAVRKALNGGGADSSSSVRVNEPQAPDHSGPISASAV